MIKKIVMLLVLCHFSLAVQADTNLEKMEMIGEEVSKYMYLSMIQQVEANGGDATKLKGLIPDSSWDQPMREATACILAKYEEKIGNSGIEKMIADIESKLPLLREKGIEAFTEVAQMQPSGVTDAEAIEFNKACGMTQLMMKKSMDSPFFTEVMKLMREN